MTKKQSTKKFKEYENMKVEIAKEVGPNNTEINAKIASQDEPKYSNKTMNRKHHIENGRKNRERE